MSKEELSSATSKLIVEDTPLEAGLELTHKVQNNLIEITT